MINEIEVEEDVETEYSYQDWPHNEQAGNQRDTNGEETMSPTLK